VALAAACAVIDVRERRIPNRLTYPAIWIGLLANAFLHGWKGLLLAIAGGLFFGGLFLLFYVLRTMGAGDVKLAAAIGSIVGLEASVQVMLATAISGGIFAVVQILRARRIGETLRNTISVAGHHVRHGMQMHPEVNLDNPKAMRMPYGLAFAAGTVYWAVSSLWWR
jgi:prepilin peptidase CpaA